MIMANGTKMNIIEMQRRGGESGLWKVHRPLIFDSRGFGECRPLQQTVSAKLVAPVVLLAWASVIVCGRMLPYL